MTIEELFGTLQQAVVGSWRKHLRTAKYGKHVALNDFYEELPDLVDALIEGYMGATGKKIKGYDNIIQSKNMNTLTYLQELKKICKQGYDLLDENEELEGLLDDIVNLINSTLYKVKELSEGQVIDLKDYVLEALNDNETNEVLNEAKKTNLEIGYVVDIIASLFPDMKWYKELRHNTVIDVLEYYALVDELIQNLDVTEDEFYDWFENNDSALAKELEDL
jgi:hypothetical protein